MKNKKIIYSVILVLLIGFALFLYSEFNGNPLSKYLSKKALESYLEIAHPDKKLQIDEGFYNFKFKEYQYTVKEIGDNPLNEYEFTVKGFLDPVVDMDGIYTGNLDEKLMEKLGKEAAEEIKSTLSKKVKSVHSVEVWLQVQKDDFPSDTNWSKEMKLEKPMGMHIVLDATNAMKKDVLKDIKQIQAILNEENYYYDSVNINGNYFGKDDEYVKDGVNLGYVKFSVSFPKDMDLTLKDIEELNP
ncbi:hypothetical protein [Metabacillus fastidiosus]|uniref:YfjL-like protein n=1 Tax=Metabacillus fastidiosus TaxID=1458 RepID=UPI003D2A738C